MTAWLGKRFGNTRPFLLTAGLFLLALYLLVGEPVVVAAPLEIADHLRLEELEQGEDVGDAMARELAEMKLCIVSGMARGIDSQAHLGGHRVLVVGDFNDWDPEATPMTRLKSGAWKATVDLEVERTYAFRYLIDGCIWENDGEADGYAPTGVDHEENSLVTV